MSIPVHVWLPGEAEPVLAGEFTPPRDRRRGEFRYDGAYLRHAGRIELDPVALPLGPQPIRELEQDGIFGVFMDTAPDTWGSRILERRLGHEPDDIEKMTLSDGDGVGNTILGDPARIKRIWPGIADLDAVAARFRDIQTRPGDAAPAWDPGTSLGGMKPKLTIEHEGELWIAKFPEVGEPVSHVRMEHAMLELARALGIDACESRVADCAGGASALLVKRFDRPALAAGAPARGRHGFASAHTVMRLRRDALLDPRSSYLSFSERIAQWCGRDAHDVVVDQQELWRRIVFNVAIANGDDHHKNHGLLRTQEGWRLSPAYDLVPARLAQRAQSMRFWIDLDRRLSGAATVHGLLSSVEYFGFGTDHGRFERALPEARRIIQGVHDRWRAAMKAAGLSEADIASREGAIRTGELLQELDAYRPPDPTAKEIRREKALARAEVARSKDRANRS